MRRGGSQVERPRGTLGPRPVRKRNPPMNVSRLLPAPGLAVVLSVGLFCLGGTAPAGDWPQFLGPGRDGVSPETGLAASWPKEGPPVVWRKDVGEGYSGPVVSGGWLVL